MKKTVFLAGAVALASTNHAGAQDDNDRGDVTMLDRIVVTTPLRRETTLERSTSSVTVIDARSIERSAAPDLPSLLKAYTGVSIITYGGQGAGANLYLRGMSASQTLVLVNGVRASSVTTGTASLGNIPLDSIERIEIAKGAHSAQYGSDAMGGVVNIITKQGGPCADGRDSSASITTGVSHPWGGTLSGNLRGRNASGVDYSIGGSVIGIFSWSNLWIYLVAELGGAAVAALVFRLVNADDHGPVPPPATEMVRDSESAGRYAQPAPTIESPSNSPSTPTQ